MDVRTDANGRTALIEIATASVGTGSEAQRIVEDVRGQMIPTAFATTNAKVLLGGNLPGFVDMKSELDVKLPMVFAFVLGLSFVLMLLVFRSVIIPAKAIVM